MLMIIIVLIIAQLFTGCWDGRELTNMLIVSGVAIDKGEKDNILLTLIAPLSMKGSVSSTNGDGSEGSNVSQGSFIVSQEGEDIMDAYRKISYRLSRQIFLAQVQTIVIGEALAKEGVSKVLDFFPRHSETPMKVFIFFTKGKAANLFHTQSQLEINIVDEIKKLKELNLGKRMQLKDFLYMMTEEGIYPSAPLIQAVTSENSNAPGATQVMSMTGAAIFKNDKLIGWMNNNEYKGVLWIQNKVKVGGITVDIPKEKGGGKVSGQIIRAKSKIVPILKNNEIQIEVSLFGKADITQSNSKLDFGKPEAIKLVEQLFSENVRKYAENSVNVAKNKFNSDILGFGAVVHGKYPKQWDAQFKKSWDENFHNLNVKISSKVQVYEIGFDTKSVTKKDEEFIQ